MIRVIVKKNNNQIMDITISGHAKSAEYGKDLVCAAVSASSVGVLNTLVAYGFEENQCGSLEMRNSYIHINVEKHTKDIQVILETLVTILETIEIKNTEFIEISNVEV